MSHPVYVVRLKDGVSFARLLPAGVRILSAIDDATSWLQCDLTISCGNEGHGPLDPHTLGEAADVSVLLLSPAKIIALLNGLRVHLGRAFYAQYETHSAPNDPQLRAIVVVNPAATAPHIHIQRAKGTVFPPPADSPAGSTPPPATSAV